MLTFTAVGRCAGCLSDEPLTSGSAGVRCVFILDTPTFGGLMPTAVFRSGGVERDMLLLSADDPPETFQNALECVVPWEVLEYPGNRLHVGVYASNAEGTIVVPTIWADAGMVLPGTKPSELDPKDPSMDIVAQLMEQAQNTVRAAQEASELYPRIVDGTWQVWNAELGEWVDTGVKAEGADGVSPTVSVTTIPGGHRVTITDAEGDHSFDVMDGGGGDPNCLVITDEEGAYWHFDSGPGQAGDITIEGEDGSTWHIASGSGDPDSINVGDGEGGAWHIPAGDGKGSGTSDYDDLVNKPTLNGVEISGDKTSEDYGIECFIPAGGNVGDLVWKTSEGTGWVTPANDLAGDNTRPITASAVDTIVGNINALLATI